MRHPVSLLFKRFSDICSQKIRREFSEPRIIGWRPYAVFFFICGILDCIFLYRGLKTTLSFAFFIQTFLSGILLALSMAQKIVGAPPLLKSLTECAHKMDEPLPDGEGEKATRTLRFVRAVVGFARLDSETGKRQQLFELATQAATQHGFIVIKENSEGFAFLANYFENANWPLNLIQFYEGLLVNLEKIPGAHAKIGVSMGPLSLQVDQEHVQASGEEILLASELCNRGGENQLVMTSKVWHSLSDSLDGWQSAAQTHLVPGFTQPIPSLHLDRRLNAEYRRHCWSCGAEVQVQQTAEGYIRVACINQHPQPQLTVVMDSTSKAA